VGFVHPQLGSWLDTHSRLLATLAQRPWTEPERRRIGRRAAWGSPVILQ
jgi:hypothetical protein